MTAGSNAPIFHSTRSLPIAHGTWRSGAPAAAQGTCGFDRSRRSRTEEAHYEDGVTAAEATVMDTNPSEQSQRLERNRPVGQTRAL